MAWEYQTPTHVEHPTRLVLEVSVLDSMRVVNYKLFSDENMRVVNYKYVRVNYK